MKRGTTRNLCKKVSKLIVFLAVGFAIGACSMPFEWAGSMPGSYASDEAEDDSGSGDTSDTSDPADTTDEPADTADNSMVKVTGSSFTLAWDSSSADTASYNLYWRNHGETEWTLLHDGVSDPSFTITTSDLDHGTYEFAVSAVSTDGVESDLHTSMDESADPEPWYLSWTAA